jgi:hypothetical protein
MGLEEGAKDKVAHHFRETEGDTRLANDAKWMLRSVPLNHVMLLRQDTKTTRDENIDQLQTQNKSTEAEHAVLKYQRAEINNNESPKTKRAAQGGQGFGVKKVSMGMLPEFCQSVQSRAHNCP